MTDIGLWVQRAIGGGQADIGLHGNTDIGLRRHWSVGEGYLAGHWVCGCSN